MRILLLSAYDAESHKQWRLGLEAQFPEYEWTQLTLPPRYFSWRIRGNSLSWAFGEDKAVLTREYDLLIATSMTDLSALKGFLPSLATVPTLVYFHENQFAYPASKHAHSSIEPQILNLYSAMAANRVVFNSTYNRESFLQGAQALLKKMPDQVPKGLLTSIERRSEVLPVPLESKRSSVGERSHTAWDQYQSLPPKARPLLLVWAARWEYDKGPERLLAVLNALEQRGVDFRLALLGPQFRQTPQAFEDLKKLHSSRIDAFGYVASKYTYRRWLAQGDIFLSTALHEFQGVSVFEAVTHRCVPVLPRRVVYPEWFSDEYMYASSLDNLPQEAESAADCIERHWQLIKSDSARAPELSKFCWPALHDAYHRVLASTVREAK